ncbi:hypothetical protein [Nocardia terpenica]|uniref:Uncharacterized protein n=1 Tax=Nocardia terpenica TaxID=455432 RepID=A0A6G9Z716_9NOCA|nr:hypothetical protein [Nocardia terpenica]QIS20956.1 hypothetical protein F6W96_24200 [Nocardia terpenica]
MNSPDRLTRALEFGVRLLPPGRRDLGAAMLAEAASITPGPTRRRWLLGTGWFITKEGTMTWLKLTSIAGSALFILWILYNGMDSGWTGTRPEIVSYIAIMTLLALNIALMSRGLLAQRHHTGR